MIESLRRIVLAPMEMRSVHTGLSAEEITVFLPIFAQKGSVPVRLTQVTIGDGSMTLAVDPMSREQQAALLERVKEKEADEDQASSR